MIALRLAEIAAYVGGEIADGDATDVVVDGPVDLDSRRLGPGGLFVAMAGDRVDGHDFVGAAASQGAVAVLGQRPTGLPTVVVDDPAAALAALARAVLARRREQPEPFTVLALTGSAGKTSTKDLMAAVLAAHGETVATAGNFNNELGVPLTALRITARTRFLVVEMGARGIGHIAMLCRIARPDVAAVLNVGTAHLGEFGSRDAIAQGKGEIVEALPASGVAVLGADDHRVAGMAPRTQARVLGFGRAEAADVRAVEESLDELGRASFTLVHGDDRAPVSLRGLGRHQVLNALAAAGAGLAVGLDVAAVAAALSEAQGGSPWRMEVHDVDGFTVVNDAYNANPESMRAALDVLAAVHGRRGIAVLGIMGELGAGAAQAHAATGAYAVGSGVAAVVVVGDGADADAMAAGAREAAEAAEAAETDSSGRPAGCEVVQVADHAAALRWLRAAVRDDDVVLTKGSRSAAMEVVALDLVEHGRHGSNASSRSNGTDTAEDHA